MTTANSVFAIVSKITFLSDGELSSCGGTSTRSLFPETPIVLWLQRLHS